MAEMIFDKAPQYIDFEYRLRSQRRPAYSLRAFARDLQMSPSGLVDFMKGRCGLSESRAQHIAQTLKWSEQRSSHFWDLIQSEFSKDPVKKRLAQQRAKRRLHKTALRINEDSFALISDWYHLAILEYFQIHPTLDLKKMAVDLKLSAKTVREAVARLKRLELIELQETGWVPTHGESHVGDEQASEAVRQFHSQVLQLGLRALEESPREERSDLSVIFSIPNKHIEKVKSELRTSIMEVLTKYVETEKPENIQVLSFHLFQIYKDPASEVSK